MWIALDFLSASPYTNCKSSEANLKKVFELRDLFVNGKIEELKLSFFEAFLARFIPKKLAIILIISFSFLILEYL